jgi:hypothetical protein
LSLVLIPIPELQHAPLPPKCYERRSIPQLGTIGLLVVNVHDLILFGHLMSFEEIILVDTRRRKMKIN